MSSKKGKYNPVLAKNTNYPGKNRATIYLEREKEKQAINREIMKRNGGRLARKKNSVVYARHGDSLLENKVNPAFDSINRKEEEDMYTSITNLPEGETNDSQEFPAKMINLKSSKEYQIKTEGTNSTGIGINKIKKSNVSKFIQNLAICYVYELQNKTVVAGFNLMDRSRIN